MRKKVKKLKWPDINNYKALAEKAQNEPETVAYEYGGSKVTCSELFRSVNRVASGLKKANLKSGDKAIVSLPDIPQAIECHYAMEKAGINLYTLHPDTKAQAIAVIAEDLNSKAIVTLDEHYEEVSKAVAGIDHPVQIILADVIFKIPKSRAKRSIFRKVKESKYSKDEYLTPWSELINK